MPFCAVASAPLRSLTGAARIRAPSASGHACRPDAGRPGRFRFQLNISNLFDETEIIPVRLATSANAPDGYLVPGRSVAYSRYDLVAPREFRFTTTYSF